MADVTTIYTGKQAVAAATAQAQTGAVAAQTAATQAQESSTTAQASSATATAAAATAQNAATQAQANATAAETNATAAQTAAAAAQQSAQQVDGAFASPPPIGVTAANTLTALFYNNTNFAGEFEIPAESNAVLFGPITLAPGGSLTVPAGSNLRIL